MKPPTPFVQERAISVERRPEGARLAGIDGAAPVNEPVQMNGDAYVTITATFFPDGDPLMLRDGYRDRGDTDLDGTGALVRSSLPLNVILRGTLTFQQPSVDELVSFVGGDEWLEQVRADLDALVGASPPVGQVYDWIELVGMLFPDGYGSLAVTLRLPRGWEPDRRATTLQAVGVEGRELLAEKLRVALLPVLDRLLRRYATGTCLGVVVPYFNLTYAGATLHPTPGRAVLADELRGLVYPDSAMPLPSSSPWMTEYLYTGYAYHLLATQEPLPHLRKLALLLLVLNVSYARLARFAAAADAALRTPARHMDAAWLAGTEHRLRAEYQSLVTPTFSFDHHALSVRDAVLKSWDVPKLQARADNLIAMVRGTVEFRLAQDQARRISRLNWLVLILTAVSIMPVIETVLAIARYLSG